MTNEVLSIEGLSIDHEGRNILSDVNFNLIQGEFCYLIGDTGSGKSSLLKTLFAELPIQKGDIKVLGKSIKNLNKRNTHSYRRRIGMVFQDFKLFEEWTVQKNLDYILRATDWTDEKLIEERIDTVLDDVNLSSAKTYDVKVLSGGEKQRLSIARALLNEPALFLADEPTGQLDVKSSERVFQLLQSLTQKRNMTSLVATHDMHLIEAFPARVVKVSGGTIKEI